jgi:hypothetical protein
MFNFGPLPPPGLLNKGAKNVSNHGNFLGCGRRLFATGQVLLLMGG